MLDALADATGISNIRAGSYKPSYLTAPDGTTTADGTPVVRIVRWTIRDANDVIVAHVDHEAVLACLHENIARKGATPSFPAAMTVRGWKRPPAAAIRGAARILQTARRATSARRPAAKPRRAGTRASRAGPAAASESDPPPPGLEVGPGTHSALVEVDADPIGGRP